MFDLDLVFGAELDGNVVKNIGLESPRSELLLYLDRYRQKGISFIRAILEKSTKRIGDVEMPKERLVKKFWGKIRWNDAAYAAIELIKQEWPEDAEGAEQVVICPQGHYSTITFNIHDIKHNLDAPLSAEYELRFPLRVHDEDVRIVKLEQITLEAREKLQRFDDSPNEASLRMLAACSSVIVSGSPIQLDIGHLMELRPYDRKRMESIVFEEFTISDMLINGECGKCGAPARGVFDISNFI